VVDPQPPAVAGAVQSGEAVDRVCRFAGACHWSTPANQHSGVNSLAKC
jgi:hypothetical protein